MADTVLLVCMHCSETRYKSIRPLSASEKMAPELFEPASEETPPPTPGQRPTCHVCGSGLQATLEKPVGSRSTNGVETLWQADNGEEIKSMRENPDGTTVIITNKRIIRVTL